MTHETYPKPAFWLFFPVRDTATRASTRLKALEHCKIKIETNENTLFCSRMYTCLFLSTVLTLPLVVLSTRSACRRTSSCLQPPRILFSARFQSRDRKQSYGHLHILLGATAKRQATPTLRDLETHGSLLSEIKPFGLTTKTWDPHGRVTHIQIDGKLLPFHRAPTASKNASFSWCHACT